MHAWSCFQKGALFVGVSRAALEAMAHGLCVILLGNEGYLGLLDESKLNTAIQTNFTCRGTAQPTLYDSFKAVFFDEIRRFFDLPENDKARLSFLSQKTVQESYTAQKMAENTVRFYIKALKKYHSDCKSNFKKATFFSHPTHKKKKIAICGYYGHKNLGDDTILSVICEIIRKNSKDKCQISALLKTSFIISYE